MLNKKSDPKYIFISGGVLSGIGKGTVSASLSFLLQRHGYKTTSIKCENYLNVDSGTINPIEHGDPFLCEDGTEADMDLGTYERFLEKNVGMDNFITMGQIYKTVIDRERAFYYHGEDVEAIPHVCDEIISRIKKAAEKDKAEIVVIELGGTAGEYQNILYYEASRQMKYREGDSVLHIHVSYMPIPAHIGEPKSKPTQLSVKTLNSMGIQPDFIVARSEKAIDTRRVDRFALFCNVKKEHIISAPDVETTIYELPLILAAQNFEGKVLAALHLKPHRLNLKDWEKLIAKIKAPKEKGVKISIVGKYFATGQYNLADSYAALIEAIKHACWNKEVKLDLNFVNSELQENDVETLIADSDGIIVPIGWGNRGVEGKIKAIKYARENKIPYLGLCYGMQLATVEFARNILGMKDANSTEVNPKTPFPIIHLIPEEERYVSIKSKGVTMRLGAWDCVVKKGTLTEQIYDKHHAFKDKHQNIVSERHRHRFEFNNDYRKQIEDAGLIISGTSPDNFFVEMIELPTDIHPFFYATQAHPEYKSSPLHPHPVFLEFIEAALKYHQ